MSHDNQSNPYGQDSLKSHSTKGINKTNRAFKIVLKDRITFSQEKAKYRNAVPSVTYALHGAKCLEIQMPAFSLVWNAPELSCPWKKAGTLIEKIIFSINNPPLRVLY